MRHLTAALLALGLLAGPAQAARDHDGANDNLAFASANVIDNYTLRTYSFWLRWDGTGVLDALVAKSNNNTTSAFMVATNAGNNALRYLYSWSGTSPAIWTGTTSLSGGGLFYVTVTYDNQLTANVPTLMVNCAADTPTTVAAASGTPNSDAGNTFRTGETDTGTADFDGVLGWLGYDDTLWSAATCNMARWGWQSGAVEIYHPLETEKLANEGATGSAADGTATGTTVVNMVAPVQRRQLGLMGVGR